MSTLLERFRARDLQKFTGSFGGEGTLTLQDASEYQVRQIPREPFRADRFDGMSIENAEPAAFFITADLPSGNLVGCFWTDETGVRRTIRGQEPNPRTGITRITLSE